MRLTLLSVVCAALCSMVMLPSAGHATPYWDAAQIERWEAQQALGAPGTPSLGAAALVPGDLTVRQERDYLAMYSSTAHFLSVWQVSTPGDPQFGGIREGEHLQDIIQTDNTSEAIWVWSRYYELTGDDQYHQNILDAFTYSLNNPAYLEEGGELPLTGYYRMYNCGWAVRAEQMYRDIYGDATYQGYANSCASYIRSHTLSWPAGTGFYHFANPPIYAWALGNLYYVGTRAGNTEWIEHAAQEAGATVKLWVEQEPTLLSSEVWAMSGGATMWGLLGSYFRAHPGEMEAWGNAYKGYLETYANPPGDFTNAWNGWYALGHRAVGEALDDAYHLGVHLTLTDGLVAEDGDGDGGIPARPPDTDQMDQTWVSNYLAFMGLDPLLPPSADAPGPLADAGWSNLRLQGVPNPAVASLHVSFSLPVAADGSLAIFDCSGRAVAQLTSGRLAAGEHAFTWSGRDDHGYPVPAGLYRAVLRTARDAAAREIVWLR